MIKFKTDPEFENSGSAQQQGEVRRKCIERNMSFAMVNF